MREDWKEDGIESNNGESSDKDEGEKCQGEIDEDSKEERRDHLVKNKDFDKQQVLISDNDKSQELDPDYVCEKESDSEASTQLDRSVDSSSLSKECKELLTELVEVIGEDKISKGSFLDYEEDWRETVKEYKDGRLSQGHCFKSARVCGRIDTSLRS